MSERLEAIAELISMCGEEASAKALASALNGLAKAIEERNDAQAAARAFRTELQYLLACYECSICQPHGIERVLAAHPGWLPSEEA